MTLPSKEKALDWITREEFEEMVEAFIQRKTPKFQAKALITTDTVQDALLVLKEKNSQVRTPSFRFWARKRFLARKEQRGGSWVLCTREDHGVVGEPVCPREELFEVITKAHINSNHRGRDPTYEWVKRSRSYVPKELCDMLVKKCTLCAAKRKTKESTDTSRVEKPIATTRFMTMLEMTLVEYQLGSKEPFILHLKDVYSNFHWAYALETTRVQSVIPVLHRVFCQFGLPSILSYNCHFTLEMMNALTHHWPTLRLIHAQIDTDHCAKKDSAFALQLSQWFQGKHHANHTVWPDCLFDFCCHLNTTTHPETGKIPHDIVFGRMPPQDDIQHLWSSILSKDSHILSDQSENIIVKMATDKD